MSIVLVLLGMFLFTAVFMFLRRDRSQAELGDAPSPPSKGESSMGDDLVGGEDDIGSENEVFIDKLILRTKRGSFPVEALREYLLSELGALADPHLADVYLLSTDAAARDELASARHEHPERLPFVGIVELRADVIVVDQNAGEGSRAKCQAFLERALETGCNVYDELGRTIAVTGGPDEVSGAPLQLSTEAPARVSDVASADAHVARLLEDHEGAASEANVRVSEHRAYEPNQLLRVWQYPDGTVVILRPAGTRQIPDPVYQVGVLKDPERGYSGPEQIAFLVNHQGKPVPKNLFDATPSPYPEDGYQDLMFKRLLVEAGTRSAPATA